MLLTEEQVPPVLRASFGLQEAPALEEGVVRSPKKKFRWPDVFLEYELSEYMSSEHTNMIKSTLDKLEKKLDSCILFNELNSGGQLFGSLLIVRRITIALMGKEP